MSDQPIPAGEAAEAVPHADPFAIFAEWFAEARRHEPGDPEAVALATATPGAAPSVRMVLMKGFGAELGT
ncbi:MAG: pyridoxamine 5'-phosphate oxidase, partial [Proteobacteria bacterium]|nr:pyridoxamine 5'-phosphate oxidase [Pseudomonadota bacterium]